MKREFPILEFDEAREAVLNPRAKKGKTLPDRAVLCFFREVVERWARERQARVAHRITWEHGTHRIFEIEWNGSRIAFLQPGVGAPMAAGIMEELIPYGVRTFVACGGAGTLRSELCVGHIILPSAAIRDEGTSYHYLPPSREIAAQPDVQTSLRRLLEERGVPYVEGKAWTTDAPYRETKAKVELRKAEGCVAVEMEMAAMLAVARFRDVRFGQMLYAGDDVGGETWDARGWSTRTDVREALFELALTACSRL
ncbi:MAG TPA: nucleoside phosphorylase [Candidatus Ozemobacteraceae bacterium]|nr:nucleoside phosphorylase [Candidatus Ozemobacteraceae bacterium]